MSVTADQVGAVTVLPICGCCGQSLVDILVMPCWLAVGTSEFAAMLATCDVDVPGMSLQPAVTALIQHAI